MSQQQHSSTLTLVLLGPPEIYRHPDPLPDASPSPPANDKSESEDPPAAASSGDPFMDVMIANFNEQRLLHKGLTENWSPTFFSTGNPCLDFFFHVVPDTPAEALTHRLNLAWSHDPSTTLKLACNLRGVRGTGKSDKEGFYTVALWIHSNHPKTLACNVASIADFGYFKDLPEILYRLLEGPDVRRIANQRRRGRGPKSKSNKTTGFFGPGDGDSDDDGGFVFSFNARGRGKNGRRLNQKEKEAAEKRRRRAASGAREERVSAETARAVKDKEEARKAREERKMAAARKLVERFGRDPDFRFLQDRVADLFADRLRADLESLGAGKANKIGLAAKWCPSLDSSFDRSTLLCEAIARKLFPRDSHPEYRGIEDAHYAYRVRERLRKQVLSPLRKALELPEIYMSANQWDSLPYNRVPSVAMKAYKEHFVKHDSERFSQYLEDVKSGKAKIAAGALLPHHIIESLSCSADSSAQAVAELQWQRLVDDMLSKGKLRNCLAICDVSGSMDGVPMEVSVALGMLVSELSEDPWKGKLITFSQSPRLHRVEGDGLKAKAEFVRKMEWGMNTDFQKVFDKILEVAVDGKLREDQMVKRVFVFSDMEFDQASANPWETDYEAISRKFREKGYGSAIPEIVFWNLRDSKATPVPSHQKGVALVSGFSKNLLTLFLEGDGIVSPEAAMEAAISGPEYQKLAVLD